MALSSDFSAMSVRCLIIIYTSAKPDLPAAPHVQPVTVTGECAVSCGVRSGAAVTHIKRGFLLQKKNRLTDIVKRPPGTIEADRSMLPCSLYHERRADVDVE